MEPNEVRTRRRTCKRPRVALVRKEDRRVRRFNALWRRFMVLPAFLAGGANDRYQRSHKVVVEFLDLGQEAPFEKLSKLLTRMERLRKVACRAEETQKKQSALRAAVANIAWELPFDLSEGELFAKIIRRARYTATSVWMFRTGTAALGRVASHAKSFLDAAMRTENARRSEHNEMHPEAKIELLTRRDDVVISGRRGAHWLQVAGNAARNALWLCDTRLAAEYPCRGASRECVGAEILRSFEERAAERARIAA